MVRDAALPFEGTMKKHRERAFAVFYVVG